MAINLSPTVMFVTFVRFKTFYTTKTTELPPRTSFASYCKKGTMSDGSMANIYDLQRIHLTLATVVIYWCFCHGLLSGTFESEMVGSLQKTKVAL